MAETFLYPVPANPPDEGDFHIVGFNKEWLPIILSLLQTVRSPAVWLDPPDSITGQVDELIYLISTNLD